MQNPFLVQGVQKWAVSWIWPVNHSLVIPDLECERMKESNRP